MHLFHFGNTPLCLSGRQGCICELLIMAVLLSMLFLWAISVFGAVPIMAPLSAL